MISLQQKIRISENLLDPVSPWDMIKRAVHSKKSLVLIKAAMPALSV
jgi:hypothetical protein